MRDDMNKVLVEKYRLARGPVKERHKVRDVEAMPKHVSMSPSRRFGYRHKQLNENLNPLWRFLDSRVGKSWDRTYSEIKSQLDERDVIQRHVFEHIRSDVQTAGARVPWYSPRYIVDERGILRRNENRRRRRAKPERRVLDPNRVLLKRDGVWYLCFLKPLPTTVMSKKELTWLPSAIAARFNSTISATSLGRHCTLIDVPVYESVHDAWLDHAVELRMTQGVFTKPWPNGECGNTYGDGTKYCVSFRKATTREYERPRK